MDKLIALIRQRPYLAASAMVEDAQQADETFTLLMGNHVASRRKFIQDHAALGYLGTLIGMRWSRCCQTAGCAPIGHKL